MPPRYIVRGQPVSREKIELAKEHRRNMTEAEQVLWQRLRANRLEGRHFRRQQVIAGFIVDFYCHSASLIVEVDGEIHEKQREADDARDQALLDLGLRVMRFENRTVLNDLPNVLKQILRACQNTSELGTVTPLTGEGLGEDTLIENAAIKSSKISPPLKGEGLGERS